MKKGILVQCCKANQFGDICRRCTHSEPHEVDPNKVCTKWGECFIENEDHPKGTYVPVRCVRVK